jgi:hypothetical protein
VDAALTKQFSRVDSQWVKYITSSGREEVLRASST